MQQPDPCEQATWNSNGLALFQHGFLDASSAELGRDVVNHLMDVGTQLFRQILRRPVADQAEKRSQGHALDMLDLIVELMEQASEPAFLTVAGVAVRSRGRGTGVLRTRRPLLARTAGVTIGR